MALRDGVEMGPETEEWTACKAAHASPGRSFSHWQLKDLLCCAEDPDVVYFAAQVPPPPTVADTKSHFPILISFCFVGIDFAFWFGVLCVGAAVVDSCCLCRCCRCYGCGYR